MVFSMHIRMSFLKAHSNPNNALHHPHPCGHPWPFLLTASDAAMVPGLIGEARGVALTRDAVRGVLLHREVRGGGLVWKAILPARHGRFRAVGDA